MTAATAFPRGVQTESGIAGTGVEQDYLIFHILLAQFIPVIASQWATSGMSVSQQEMPNRLLKDLRAYIPTVHKIMEENLLAQVRPEFSKTGS